MSRGVRVLRGGVVESVHRVHVAVVNAEGRVVGRHGDSGWVAFYRSAAKPMQALPLVEDGVADRLALSERELALCCASHNSEPEHLDGARAILAKAGLAEDALQCGSHIPLREGTARELFSSSIELTAIHNNCSGKHAGMLALAVVNGWPTDGYLESDHPVQRRMLAEMSRWTEVPEADIPTGIDGCGVVSFALSLERMAASFARFEAASHRGEPASRIVSAMTGHPFMVAGTDRTCTVVMERLGDRVFLKTGAEGVYCGALRGQGVGFALKVEDGARRASDVALVQVLVDLGVVHQSDFDALASLGAPCVANTLGRPVGSLESSFSVATVA